jgi:DNA-binding Lrp family transcriptional regulator
MTLEADLPAELLEQLSKRYKNGDATSEEFAEKIAPIFKEKETLTIDDVLVEWYRHYNQVLKRGTVINRMSRLEKSGVIKKNGQKYTKP